MVIVPVGFYELVFCTSFKKRAKSTSQLKQIKFWVNKMFKNGSILIPLNLRPSLKKKLRLFRILEICNTQVKKIVKTRFLENYMLLLVCNTGTIQFRITAHKRKMQLHITTWTCRSKHNLWRRISTHLLVPTL